MRGLQLKTNKGADTLKLTQAKKLELITKHGRKFTTKPNGATPVLEGIHYAAGGSVVVTDRHKLMRIGGAHGFTEPFTSHAVTGGRLDGQYPDTSKIIPQDFKSTITLLNVGKRSDLKDMTARVKLAVDISKIAGDPAKIATIRKKADGTPLLTVDNSELSLKYSVALTADTDGDDVEVSFNAEYMLAALNVFKDAGSARITIGMNGAMSIIVLRDEDNEIDVVVLPYRRAA